MLMRTGPFRGFGRLAHQTFGMAARRRVIKA